jgi:hypothetical protein
MSAYWRLDDALRGEIAVAAGASASLPAGAEVVERHVAASLVDRWFAGGDRTGGAHRVLREISVHLGSPSPTGTPGELGALRETARRALLNGRLVAYRRPTVLAARGGAEEEVEAPAQRVAPREEKTWVEIVLVTDEDPPAPVAFKKYRLELPDGSIREGMLDAHGAARITGIDPGSCHVTFPDIDGRDVRAG